LSAEPHVVIDLAPERLGFCYAVAWDTYNLVGEMPIVARSVAELFHVLLHDAGADALLVSASDPGRGRLRPVIRAGMPRRSAR
jgi:hypothetical protein